jgi:PAS domain S-box-containing protein
MRRDFFYVATCLNRHVFRENRRFKIARNVDDMPKKIKWDIVALKESEERFRMIAERSTIGIFLYQDEKFLYVNPAMEKLTGYSADELLAVKMWKYVHKDFQNLMRQRGLAMQQGELVPAEYEFKHITKEGNEGWVLLSATRVEYKGHPAGIGTVIDISERKRTEEKLKEVREELVRKERLAMLGTIAAGMGNELRNPLGVISNALYFLKTVMPDADDTIKEYLDIIKNEIYHSEYIISNLLDSVRINMPEKRPVTAGALIYKSLDSVTIPPKVIVRADIPDAIPELCIDPFQIEKALQNLITNAVQAMPTGGVLTMSARLVEEVRDRGSSSATIDPDGGFVEISVADTGKGVSPENIKKLFQPLFTTKARGMGLGLVVCKNLIEANSGSIEVESERGKGTKFMVVLPCQYRE